ncbi:dGTPase [Edwardsiella piscicida]|uniref:dGTPase n=1 Tax=Edwardsiella piscicida TaxID=1263550 RepID=UPI00084C4C56|nr:dGTPase [Edwardsiella piscicida]EKS7766285.1 dGTPase [Edwardsiella piscicida]UCQ30616.1 dGTPase [Edwardsiella piscicida]UCQ56943.1 dGTPase [Edwardsiella piscicida]
MSIDFASKLSYQRPLRSAEEALFLNGAYEIGRQFESDRGRIINSAAIRRLQQKTQVFPLERNAAVRSRLTHSMEVQQVGRHIAREILHCLSSKGRIAALGLADYSDAFESCVEMACLMHDMGNPPFGHFGEAAIKAWFSRELGVSADGHNRLDDAACQVAFLRRDGRDAELDTLRARLRIDLSNFEGNAQSIRLIHTLLKLNLTYAQTACVLKYTRPAYWQGPLPAGFDYLMKKPGYYWAEEAFVEQLRQQVDLLPHHRFPLTYIMEAADDISYCVADLEDTVEKHLLSVEQLYALLKDEWGAVTSGDLFSVTVQDAFDRCNKKYGHRSADDIFFMYLRVNVVKRLVPYAADCFLNNLQHIFIGAFNEPLLSAGAEEYRLLNIFKQVALKHVFNHFEVEQLELQGYRVIKGLLDIYSPLLAMPQSDFLRLLRDDRHPDYLIETRLFHKLSVKHRLAYREAVDGLAAFDGAELQAREYYYRARLIQDYISGMTDLYAYDEYRRLMAAE